MLNPSKVVIKKPATILQLLRSFGHMLKDIYINFDSLEQNVNVNFCAEVECYLAKYCSVSLHRLTLRCNPSEWRLKNLHKPLSNVTALKIHLDLKHRSYLLLNGRLPNRLHFDYKDRLPKLTNIYVKTMEYHYDYKWEPIHFENVETITIENSAMLREFPFSFGPFGKLKHLAFINSVLNDAFLQFVRNIGHLTSLKMFRVNYKRSRFIAGNFTKLLESPNLLSTIEELFIELNESMSSVDILHFLERSQKLKTFAILCEKFEGCRFPRGLEELEASSVEYREKIENLWKTITSRLDFKWKCYVIDDFKNPMKEQVQYYCHIIERIN